MLPQGAVNWHKEVIPRKGCFNISCVVKRLIASNKIVLCLGCISLLPLRLPKLPIRFYSNGLGILGNLGNNEEMQPQCYIVYKNIFLFVSYHHMYECHVIDLLCICPYCPSSGLANAIPMGRANRAIWAALKKYSLISPLMY